MRRPLKHRLRRPDPIKAEISVVRRKASEQGLTHVVEQIDEIKQALDQGYTVRAGPFEVRPRMMHPLWKKPPPEKD